MRIQTPRNADFAESLTSPSAKATTGDHRPKNHLDKAQAPELGFHMTTQHPHPFSFFGFSAMPTSSDGSTLLGLVSDPIGGVLCTLGMVL